VFFFQGKYELKKIIPTIRKFFYVNHFDLLFDPTFFVLQKILHVYVYVYVYAYTQLKLTKTVYCDIIDIFYLYGCAVFQYN
jgi:hypothetical protein